jgi:erythromycin 3''-O-methyltransferase
MSAFTRANLKHLGLFLRLGRNPAATVYESLGPEFFVAPAPGWLNLGLWDGSVPSGDGLAAVRNLVSTLARELPTEGVILDVGNGLGAQDPVIREVARPRELIALNITETQLRQGRARLDAAGAYPVNADATHIPLKDHSVDGVISVEAAFHFPSRAAFFAECRRVMRPGSILSMSDVSAERVPVRPAEVFAGITNLRVWGLKARNMVSAEEIRRQIVVAGFVDVEVRRCGDRVIEPAITYLRAQIATAGGAPLVMRWGTRLLLNQWELLHRRGTIEYLLITARVPS